MMEIQISSCSRTKLIGGEQKNTQPFLILNLIGSYFLLTKANPKVGLEKNIIFQSDSKQYYSTFARHVNLSYAGKLSEIVENIDILMKPGLQHEWLTLYQIHDFIASSTQNYKIQAPIYGSEVVVHSKDGRMHKSFVSNMLRLNGQTFYFLNTASEGTEQFGIITDIKNKVIYGITYLIKQVIICLPFNSICSEKPCAMNIAPSIRPLLARTCYVKRGSSYCTGFIRNENYVISAKHLLAFQDQKVGIQVGVRFYPYTEEKIGYVSRIGEGRVDIIEIKLANILISKTPTATFEQKSEQFVGKQVLALGFGRFGFSPKIFHRIDVVMPTIETGIVSKLIILGNTCVFIKTDASLYNGFSGCGIWLKGKLIGMAVFILKNKNSNSMFNRHNFSYSTDFIFKLLDGDSKQYLVSQINNQLASFDKIQTRFFVPLPRL